MHHQQEISSPQRTDFLSITCQHRTRLYSENTWSQLEEDICQYSDFGKIVLFGDYSSCVGTISDFKVQDDNKYTSNSDTYVSNENMIESCSMDACVNDYGKKLIEVCKKGLRIANGRVLGDLNGKFVFNKLSKLPSDFQIAVDGRMKRRYVYNLALLSMERQIKRN